MGNDCAVALAVFAYNVNRGKSAASLGFGKSARHLRTVFFVGRIKLIQKQSVTDMKNSGVGILREIFGSEQIVSALMREESALTGRTDSHDISEGGDSLAPQAGGID